MSTDVAGSRAYAALMDTVTDPSLAGFVKGAPAVLERYVAVAERATEILSLHPGAAHAHEDEATESVRAAERTITAGGRVLDVHTRPVWAHRPFEQWGLREEAAVGVVKRRAEVPTRLVVFDREIVFVAAPRQDVTSGALVSRAPEAVSLALTVFSRCWRAGTALLDDSQALPRQLLVLRALADGHTDARIARDLAISPRTVSRVIEALHRELGATSRFQLAVRAQQAGLLD